MVPRLTSSFVDPFANERAGPPLLVRNQPQRLPNISNNVGLNVPKLSSPSHNFAVNQRAPKRPLILRMGTARKWTSFKFHQWKLHKKLLGDLTGKDPEKILKLGS